MRNIIVVGAQWGDEGKGKIVDLLAPHFDIVVRCQGGHNAGHTVVVGDRRFVLRLIPSGILHSSKHCIIGNGVVLDPQAFQAEIAEIQAVGIDVTDRLWVSDRAHLILPYHCAVDAANEEARGKNKVGTTQRGIGPTYEDKIGRRGLRASDLVDLERFKADVLANFANVQQYFQASGKNLELDNELYRNYFQAAEQTAPLVKNTTYYLNDALRAGKNILLEGAQGTMLDIDHGTYPFVTSSNATAGGAITGSGLAPGKITGVLGIAKAYTTRVGSGPFPTELDDDLGEHLRKQGNEYGSVTGRSRRTGWFDAVVVRYAVVVNGINAIALTKLDILDQLAEIKICTGYHIGGKEVREMPASLSQLAEAVPIYETVRGWQQNTAGVKDYNELPQLARDYIQRLSDLIECPVGLISTGPERDETILRPNDLMQGWLA